MTVKELFNQCDPNKVANIIAKEYKFADYQDSPNDDNCDIKRYSESVCDYFLKALKVKERVCPNETIFVEYYPSDLIIGGEDVHVFSMTDGDAERYGVETQDWKDILGSNVSFDKCSNKSLEEVAAAIFWEMSFFGWTYRK